MATTARGTYLAQSRAASRGRLRRSSRPTAPGAPASVNPTEASDPPHSAGEATVEGWGAVFLAIVLAVMAVSLLAVLFSA